MQKIIVSLFVFMMAAAPAFASWPENSWYNQMPLLEVDRTVGSYVQADAWKQILKKTQTQFQQVRHNYVASPLPQDCIHVLSYREQQTYLKRLMALQGLVNRNVSLHGFTFVAPVPTDLAHLRKDNLEVLRTFLQDGKGISVSPVEQVRPFTLAVRMRRGRAAVEIWMDVPAKKIYLMSDNLYTTAVGKYGLHLR